MRTHPLFTLTLSVLLLAACATHGPDGDRGHRDDSGESRSRRPRGEQRSSDGPGSIREDLQTQLSEVEQRLSLTPFQQVRWDRYREAVGALMADQLRMDPRPVARVDAPRQIERRVDLVRNRLVAMEDIAEAAKQLYGSLDDEQKRIADRLLPGTVPALYSGLGPRQEDGERGGRGERGGGSPGGRRD